MLSLILKISLLSLGLSVLIKYALPLVSIPATSGVALSIVLLPSIILALIFSWQTLTRESIED